MESTGATHTERAINARVARYKARMGEIVQSISPSIPPACNKSVPVEQNSPPAYDASIPTTVTPARPLARMVSGKKRPCKQLGKKCDVDSYEVAICPTDSSCLHLLPLYDGLPMQSRTRGARHHYHQSYGCQRKNNTQQQQIHRPSLLSTNTSAFSPLNNDLK